MTAFDIIVFTLLGGGAVFGFLRGFVQEVLSLIGWVLIVIAIRFGHGPISALLTDWVGTEMGAATLAFVAIFIVMFALGKWIATSIGARSRKSVLGPVDRVLGFGFGAVKGLIAATLLYLLAVLVFETVYGDTADRPAWLADSRTYPLLNASGEALSVFIAEQRGTATDEAEAQDANVQEARQ